MSCHYCHSDETILSLRQELAIKNHQLQRLELDLLTLNQKYVAEIERVGNIQHEKDLVEHELEDFSRNLFEEANAMVSIEKRARWQIENELAQTQEQLLAERDQLHELRLKLTTNDAVNNSRIKIPPHNIRAQMDLEELHGLKRASANHLYNYNNNEKKSTLSLPPPSKPVICKQITTIDELQLESFREYTNAAKNSVSPKKLNQTNFMKHCLSEDVEPCLRFGPQSRLSIKKMINYLSRQPCFIENATHLQQNQPHQHQQQQQRPLWERFSNTTINIVVSNSCSACGSNQPLNYRFKLDENENWLPIDQYCRDRLVAVCEFFVFIRNIQLGLYSDRTIQDLYTENIRLRLQMFYSRMGALPVVLNDLGLDPNQVGKATEPTSTVDDGSDGSISTGPNTPEQHLSPISSTWAIELSSIKS
ncbi:uncharacterized protein EV154DRAFT_14343 [Mucor mucedo]|uniref:uncharacterized protein n=1 Tax=Mucor mucedo TaxID=29922 RepID=UPI00221FF7DC|nr:uncharacterized protein EV154DRAFT_14343 [Mucor mucedo]KAI7887246.1 hypothetical protein EV154DRAFT_14343 [Mucor mucedo]